MFLKENPDKKKNMPKCEIEIYWNCISVWVVSFKFAAYFQNTFL